ncbi:stage IV sporulation protein FA [Gracilibacillus halophilus YIM-C55.5]|uniref:Stage IV sporulation protein FA n=1 Tax=Gracilibacillus halophilus YIM-C55.5 TaxID=1308866 RepID=N4WY13_9BACI|nr:M23 family metallopeptidase [Gracilibacillus halophilus]ENH97956.1 stage IV sporulation protein FA [Gracilibacillus halophilus YIM-C55.5]
MKKNLSEIRNNIAKRKKQKHKFTTAKAPKIPHDDSLFHKVPVEDEERHGHVPTMPSWQRRQQDTPLLRSFLMKSIIATALFFGSVVTLSSNHQWLQQPKQWTSQALTEEFPFATVNAWYQAKFGAPFAVSSNQNVQNSDQVQALPVNGQIRQTFGENGRGVRISTQEESDVIAIKAGTVLFAGNDRETGKTVIVQHQDRSKSVYGHLTDIQVHSYQSIRANQTIGTFAPDEEAEETMYFAIEKNQQFIDPIRVMQVDDQS